MLCPTLFPTRCCGAAATRCCCSGREWAACWSHWRAAGTGGIWGAAGRQLLPAKWTVGRADGALLLLACKFVGCLQGVACFSSPSPQAAHATLPACLRHYTQHASQAVPSLPVASSISPLSACTCSSPTGTRCCAPPHCNQSSKPVPSCLHLPLTLQACASSPPPALTCCAAPPCRIFPTIRAILRSRFSLTCRRAHPHRRPPLPAAPRAASPGQRAGNGLHQPRGSAVRRPPPV